MVPKPMFVYIMTNKINTTLYVGVTNDLYRRVYQHKRGEVDSFSRKYRLSKLVYYETVTGTSVAIQREKQLKNWRRQWKVDLISENNPAFDDLSVSVLGLSEGLIAIVDETLNQVQGDGYKEFVNAETSSA